MLLFLLHLSLFAIICVRLSKLERLLKKILRKLKPTKVPPAALVRFYIDGREVHSMADIKVTETKSASIVISDIKGNPAQVDGAPVWSLTDPSLATLTPSEDGMSCGIAPVGPVGSCTLQVNADADLGEGVVTIAGELPLVFIAGEAVSVSISIA